MVKDNKLDENAKKLPEVVASNYEEDDDDDEDDEDFNVKDESDSDSGQTDPETDLSVNDSDEAVSFRVSTDHLSALWDEFNRSVAEANAKDKAEKEAKEKSEEEAKKKEVVTKEYDFAGETVVVQEEVSSDQTKEKAASETTPDCEASSSQAGSSGKRPSGGLASMLSQLKKPKMSTLSKSMLDWNDYKKSIAIEEELDSHRRSKGSYIERQAFLARTDLREFEQEKSIREQLRNIRDRKNNK